MNADLVHRLNEALAGRYRIERQIGEGGMATVYLADDLKHERKVALKLLRPELAAVVGADRFLSEIRTTANLQHPHILPLFDSGEADGFLYYVMPFVEGETLRHRLDREVQLGVGEAVRIARSVAGALQAAHEAGVIHRDIKPENVLLSRGEPLVSDFGIALAVSQAGGGRLTETGLSLGTPYYMSPEQAAADRDPGRTSDVFSLGCVLYEMLVGDPPHTGSSAQAVLAKILTEEPRPVTSIRKTVPQNVADAVARALERLPADRFESADQFSRALADPGFRHMGPEGAGTRGEGAGPGPASTRRPAAGLIPWVLAAAAVIAAVAGWMRGVDAPSTGPTELWMDAGVEELAGGATVAVSPDGRTFSIARREGSDSPLYVRTADTPRWQALPGTEGARFPSFSPDGRRMAYVAEDRNLMTVSVTGGSPLTVHSAGEDLYESHWGANGDIVVATDRGLRYFPSSGGIDSLALQDEAYWPYILPAGSGVLYGSGGSIKLVDVSGDSSRVLLEQGARPIYLESGHILFAHPAGGLQAVAFDLRTHRVRGVPVPVLDGVVARGFAVSASGTLLYRTGLASSGNTGRFLQIGFDASVDTLRIPERNQRGVRISPDATRMAFDVSEDEGTVQIYTYDLARRAGPTRLTFEGVNLNPVWSPDGSRIAYARDGDIYAVAVGDGAPPVLLLETEGGVLTPWDWTRDGELLLGSRVGSQGDLVRMPSADSAEVLDLLRTDFSEFNSVVSPDGRWMAYQSNETGQPEVFLRAYPSALGQRSVSRGPGRIPRWSAEGDAVLFTRGTGANDSILSVSVEFEPVFAIGDPEVVWVGDVRDFDVLPDGQGLVVVENVPANASAGPDEAPEPSRLVIVLDWLHHLRERLAAAGGG